MLKNIIRTIRLRYQYNQNPEKVFLSALQSENLWELAKIRKWGHDFNEPLAGEIHLSGMAPLHICAQFQLKKSLAFLVESGVDINTRDINGRSTLMFALIFSRNKTQDFLDFLMTYPLDYRHQDINGKNALFYIYRSSDPVAVMDKMLLNGAELLQSSQHSQDYESFVDYAAHSVSQNKNPELARDVFLRVLDYISEVKPEYMQTTDKMVNEKATALYERQTLQSTVADSSRRQKFKL